MSEIRLVSRRGALQSFFSAGALILGTQVLPFSAEAAEAGAGATAGNVTWQPNVYLGLERDGTVVILAHRSEMGTGIRSVLPMVVAEELDADWNKVKVVQAVGDAKYGSQNTDGSCSIRDFYIAMQRSGATARTMLEKAAADVWKVPAGECSAKMNQIVHTASGKKMSFGELVEAASKLPVPPAEQLKFKAPAEYRYIGKDMPTIDRDGLCEGKGIFGMDATVPGMLYASIAHPPVLGGTVKTCDDAKALQFPGVKQVVKLDAFKPPHAFQPLGGVAVLADNTWAAMEGRKRLAIEWEHGANASFDSEAYKTALIATAKTPGQVKRNLGDVDAEFAKGGKTMEADYYVPLLSHAPMEPPAAIAEWKDGKVEAWAATQNPQAVQSAVASAMGIKKEDVLCHVTLLGGGFGRKSKPDYVVEAAKLSQAAGKPVKVVWSREDDLQFDYYHSVAGLYVKAAIDDKGMPTAILKRSVFPPIGSMNQVGSKYASDGEMGLGWIDMPFDIPNIRAENGPAEAHVRIGWMRSVSNIYHAFAIHSFMDELAAAANRDRVEYLLAALGKDRKLDLAAQGVKGKMDPRFPIETGRLRRVIELVAEKSEWAKNKPAKGRALGIAAHRSFQSYVATVVEVEVRPDGRIRIPRIDMAVDAGTIISPERVRSQFEGAAVFGASVALMGEITAKAGVIQQRNFADYPVARMDEAPIQTNVHLVSSQEPPAGVGEPGVPPVVPAICNAIFAATGKRIRHLPLSRHKLV